MRVVQFRLVDKEGNEVARGSNKELRDRGFINKSANLYSYYIKKTLAKKKYRVEKLPDKVFEGKSELKKRNTKNYRTIYGLYDGEKEIIRGTQREFQEKGYLKNSSSLASYSKSPNRRLNGYQVKIIGSLSLNDGKLYPYVNKNNNGIVKEKPKQTTELEYLQYHLNKFGNTFTRKNPAIYCDELHKMGIDINITRMKDSRGIGYLVDKI